MRVLVVGSGGREHALAWKLFASARVETVICAPGNAGTSFLGPSVSVDALDAARVLEEARKQRVDLTIVGPEAPLAAGIVDLFRANEMKVFGPTQAAARLESSKAWAKDLMRRYSIPTGRAEAVESLAAAQAAVKRFGFPVVIKADGLASGKGVTVATTAEEADAALNRLFVDKAFGPAGERVLIEEFLEGRELSVLAFTDGERLAMMPPARDYKRLLDGDQGPNTGGMGGYTRPADATPGLLARVEQEILKPTLRAMAAEGHPFTGVLYAGLMLTADGPKVVEFNCRFGDPETQLILPLLESDLFEICLAIAEGQFDPAIVRWGGGATCGVVLATGGYPDEPRYGDVVTGLDELEPGVLAFHGGTTLRQESRFFGGGARSLLTSGGRVATIVATATNLASARQLVYENLANVDFAGLQFRTDVGQDDWASASPPISLPSDASVADGLAAAVSASAPPHAADDSLVPAAGVSSDAASASDGAGPASAATAVLLVSAAPDEHGALAETRRLLDQLGVSQAEATLSAYRAPAEAERTVREAALNGVRVIVVLAASEPSLPGLLAAWSGVPVIAAVHSAGERAAEDALRAVTMVPDGAPVAVVGLDERGARTAAWLAATIVGQSNARVAERVKRLRSQVGAARPA